MSSLEQIGQKLKTARENRGLTLGQIYDRTKIPVNNLEALEQGDTGQLPEPVYVAGFIKRYADCVGLNGQTLSIEFKEHVESSHDQEAGLFGGFIKNNNGHKSKAVALQSAPVVSQKLNRVSFEPPKPSILKTIFYPAVLLVLVLGCIVYLVILQQQQFFDRENQDEASLIGLRDSASKYNSNAMNSGVSPSTTTGATTQENTPAADDCRVNISASQHVWVEVKSVKTGESKFTGFLEAGDRRDFQDEQGLRIRAGNGGSLNVSYRGKHETFGQAGRKADRTFLAKEGGGAGAATASDGTGEATATTAAVTDVKPKVKPRVRKEWTPKPAKQAERSVSDTPSRYIPGDSGGGSRLSGFLTAILMDVLTASKN